MRCNCQTPSPCSQLVIRISGGPLLIRIRGCYQVNEYLKVMNPWTWIPRGASVSGNFRGQDKWMLIRMRPHILSNRWSVPQLCWDGFKLCRASRSPPGMSRCHRSGMQDAPRGMVWREGKKNRLVYREISFFFSKNEREEDFSLALYGAMSWYSVTLSLWTAAEPDQWCDYQHFSCCNLTQNWLR